MNEVMVQELKASVQKFESQIEHAIQQVNGDVQLFMPDIIIDDPMAFVDDYDTISMLESALEGWSKAVAHVFDQETRKVRIAPQTGTVD
jgi:dynein heavy chain